MIKHPIECGGSVSSSLCAICKIACLQSCVVVWGVFFRSALARLISKDIISDISLAGATVERSRTSSLFFHQPCLKFTEDVYFSLRNYLDFIFDLFYLCSRKKIPVHCCSLLCGHINACLQKKQSEWKGECLLAIMLTQFFMVRGRSLWVLML